MSANRELWEKGDFTRIAATMRGSGEALVERLGLAAGMDVLDLGCGDGTTALPAAERGAEVLGVDIAASLLAAGRARAAAAGLDNVRFQQGDAAALTGLDDERFDLTLSAFGAMFAPRPYAVAKEMVRVTRPGGRIVMANWIPGDPTLVTQILRIAAAYSPPPPRGFISPLTWGDEEEVVRRFGEAGVAAAQIGFERGSWILRYAGPPEELVGVFRDCYGPTMDAFAAAAAAAGRDGRLRAELDALFAEQNRGVGGGAEIAASFLVVDVNRS